MTRSRLYLLVVVILAVAAALYLRGDWGGMWSQGGGQVNSLSSNSPTTVAAAETRSTREEAEDSVSVPGGSGAKNLVNCLSESQLESHPLVSDELARYDSLAVTGPTMASYRGLSHANSKLWLSRKILLRWPFWGQYQLCVPED